MRLVAAASLIALAGQAAAQVTCGPVDHVLASLLTRHGEHLDMVGIEDGSTTYQWWVNREAATWSLLRVTSDGVACLIAAEFDFSDDRTPPVGEAL